MDAPEGYTPFGMGTGFIRYVGPIYHKPGGKGARTWLQLEERHVNGWGVAHGGLMMTMMDITLGAATIAHMGQMGAYPTIQLNCNFISGAARQGDVIEGEAEVTRASKHLCFLSGRLFKGDEISLSATGIFRIPAKG